MNIRCCHFSFLIAYIVSRMNLLSLSCVKHVLCTPQTKTTVCTQMLCINMSHAVCKNATGFFSSGCRGTKKLPGTFAFIIFQLEKQ